MTVSKSEFEQLKAQVTAANIALNYTIAIVSESIPGLKPGVANALREDSKLNRIQNPAAAEALSQLADAIEYFKVVYVNK